jgi:hypothetical protein
MTMKTKQVYLYLEQCMGRLQGGETLRTVDSNGYCIRESVSSRRGPLGATYRRLVNMGAHGEVFTCHGKGTWVTHIEHDRYN